MALPTTTPPLVDTPPVILRTTLVLRPPLPEPTRDGEWRYLWQRQHPVGLADAAQEPPPFLLRIPAPCWRAATRQMATFPAPGRYLLHGWMGLHPSGALMFTAWTMEAHPDAFAPTEETRDGDL